jgi:hypothetical protein
MRSGPTPPRRRRLLLVAGGLGLAALVAVIVIAAAGHDDGVVFLSGTPDPARVAELEAKGYTCTHKTKGTELMAVRGVECRPPAGG